MPSSHIIRIPRTDEDGAFVLGEVTPSGSKPLNVKVVATEGEEPYVVKCESTLPPTVQRGFPSRHVTCYLCSTDASRSHP
jgi:hypothetical protein